MKKNKKAPNNKKLSKVIKEVKEDSIQPREELFDEIIKKVVKSDKNNG